MNENETNYRTNVLPGPVLSWVHHGRVAQIELLCSSIGMFRPGKLCPMRRTLPVT